MYVFPYLLPHLTQPLLLAVITTVIQDCYLPLLLRIVSHSHYLPLLLRVVICYVPCHLAVFSLNFISPSHHRISLIPSPISTVLHSPLVV